MAICEDHLEFRGVGFHSWELHRYEISRERVETILTRSMTGSSTTGKPWFLPMFVSRLYGIQVVSKPGGAFGDRDEYRFAFDSPALEEVLGTLRAAGYPVPAPGH